MEQNWTACCPDTQPRQSLFLVIFLISFLPTATSLPTTPMQNRHFSSRSALYRVQPIPAHLSKCSSSSSNPSLCYAMKVVLYTYSSWFSITNCLLTGSTLQGESSKNSPLQSSPQSPLQHEMGATALNITLFRHRSAALVSIISE